jgi:6-phosphogluconolactonase
VANGSTANISVLGITATDGVLSAVLGSPFAAGTFPRGLAIDPSGKFLYVANSSSSISTGNYVLGFSIDPSGGLTPVPGSPFAAGLNPVSVAVEPSGRFVYVADNGGSSISAYSLNSTSGALTPITGSPFTIPNFPIALTVDGSGKYVLVGHDGTTGVSVLAIDGTTGGLTPVSGSPFPAATKVFGITSTFTIQ